MKKQLIIGGSLEDSARRVIEAVHRAERGEMVEPEDTITFVSWPAFMSVMTGKRSELLQHLHLHPAPSIRALARELGRDFKRVHEDVTALREIGLIERTGGLLRADYEQIQSTFHMGASAA